MCPGELLGLVTVLPSLGSTSSGYHSHTFFQENELLTDSDFGFLGDTISYISSMNWGLNIFIFNMISVCMYISIYVHTQILQTEWNENILFKSKHKCKTRPPNQVVSRNIHLFFTFWFSDSLKTLNTMCTIMKHKSEKIRNFHVSHYPNQN